MRLGLDCVDEVGELDSVLDEEDRNYEGSVNNAVSVPRLRLDLLSLPTMSQLPSSV